MKIALLCSGLGNINRGHEVFARDLFDLLRHDVDITLFKGGGTNSEKELVIDNVSRRATCLDHIKVTTSPKWADSVREQERERIEALTFAYAALKPLLEGRFDIIHCLERDVCEVIYAFRHFFQTTPRVVFSNGGTLPARDLPSCDFVQEHSDHNLALSNPNKAFMIPHGVDLERFNPDIETDFRARHGIPDNAFVVISVGTICYWHKRMDYVIQELAEIDDVYLIIAGQESDDSPAIKNLGRELMPDRLLFVTLSHDELPQAYAAADVFVLGSLFETFGIVYIEALAMGLPVICTNHQNQRSIVKQGVFIDMAKPGALKQAIKSLTPSQLQALSENGPAIAREHYDLNKLRARYIAEYERISSSQPRLPEWNWRKQIISNTKNVIRQTRKLLRV